MINEDAAKRAEVWVEEARAGGAKLLAGGKRRGALSSLLYSHIRSLTCA